MDYTNILEKFPVLKQIGIISDQMNFSTYVVGGFVRDFLLDRKEKKSDIDIVTVGSGIELAKEVADHIGIKGKISVFKNFGTAMFRYGKIELEFVGARKESYNRESRKPVVENGTLADDQLRRDFTINAMAIGLNRQNYGRLIDPFEGMKDLEKKMIRTPRDPLVTFSDDPLRMMRAIRFAAQLNFDIEPNTFDSIIRNKKRIEIVSQERITQELNKIILSDPPSYGFQLMYHSGLLETVLPEMTALQGVEKIKGKGHKDNFYHTLMVLDNVAGKSADIWLRWAAILHDIAKPVTQRFDEKAGWTFHGHEEIGARMVPKIFRRLKLPMNDPLRFVQKLVRLHLRPIALASDEITDSAVRRLLFEAGDDVDKLMQLCKADITSKNPEKVKRYLSNFARVEEKLVEVEDKDRVRNFQPPVSGEEIMETFGLKPGRMVGDIKNEIKEAIMDGKIKNDYQEAYRYMIMIAEKSGLSIKNKN
ncbi:MAG: HD domain-containing protein [Cyclobacteriaceae bacterium]|nr:HD domain-containing protein [Cyclobacteriaceae bacterium]